MLWLEASMYLFYALCMSNVRWLGKDMQKKEFFIFPTFHFPDVFQLKKFVCVFFSFSRLFTSVFPTFYFRFPDFSLPEVKSRENGSKKSGKRK